jgi:hypothetical protein
MSSFKGVDSTDVFDISEVELGVNYALIISTNAGLWRYITGDTVVFTSVSPYRFKITGRTKSFINAFGEEVIVENAEQAIAHAAKKTEAVIREYTACPIYLSGLDRGAHEWAIEFIIQPNDAERFQFLLDEKLRELNSDYDAKRHKDMVLQAPVVRYLPQGSFDNWLKSIGKLGGQHKVPRLSNDRTIMDQVLQLARNTHHV